MGQLVRLMFQSNLSVMRILGFYPTRQYRRLYKLYSFLVYSIFTISVPVLSILYLIAAPDITFDKITENSFVICELGCFIFKMIPFVVKDQNIRKCIYTMEHPIFLSYAKEQKILIAECSKICRYTTWLFLSCCSVNVAAWSLTPLLEKDQKLPLDIWLPESFWQNSKLYCISFAYVVIGTGHGAISNGAVDPLIATMAYFITTQIKILKYNLQHLNNEVEEDETKNERIYDRIKQCVEHHKMIIEFVENYEKIFSPVVFTQFSASIFVICVCCFKLSQTTLSLMSCIWMVAFLITMLSEIFLYCFFGTTLSEENNTLVQAVYMGNWYDYDLQAQKALMTLMERSQRPMVVTAGKILDLSLNTFTTILKRAYSLFAVLKNY